MLWKNAHLVEVLFEQAPPQKMIDSKGQFAVDKLEFSNQGLNDAQREAVSNCLLAQDVSMIHGPPGTGKTTTVVELILQTVRL